LNCLELHKYTLQEKNIAARGEGPGFDGEMNNFQAPQLSSLAKLVGILLFGYRCLPLMDAVIRIWMTSSSCDTPHILFFSSFLSMHYISPSQPTISPLFTPA
jgi:hypothetical protein